MGWAFGKNQWGEDVGYGVPAICAAKDCEKKIDRGLGYTCGGLEGHSGEYGCGKPFCGSHLHYRVWEDDEPEPQYTDAVCEDCLNEVENDE